MVSHGGCNLWSLRCEGLGSRKSWKKANVVRTERGKCAIHSALVRRVGHDTRRNRLGKASQPFTHIHCRCRGSVSSDSRRVLCLCDQRYPVPRNSLVYWCIFKSFGESPDLAARSLYQEKTQDLMKSCGFFIADIPGLGQSTTTWSTMRKSPSFA